MRKKETAAAACWGRGGRKVTEKNMKGFSVRVSTRIPQK